MSQIVNRHALKACATQGIHKPSVAGLTSAASLHVLAIVPREQQVVFSPPPWDFAFKPEFHYAPVDYIADDRELILTVAGRVMNKASYHRLPEYND